MFFFLSIKIKIKYLDKKCFKYETSFFMGQILKLVKIQFFYRFLTIWRTAALPCRSEFYRKERGKVTLDCGTVTLFGKNR